MKLSKKFVLEQYIEELRLRLQGEFDDKMYNILMAERNKAINEYDDLYGRSADKRDPLEPNDMDNGEWGYQ